MRIPIEMVSVGFEQKTAKIGGWIKRVGERVERGDVIAEVETEKTMVELEALDAGTLVEIVHQGGDEVAVGTVIGYLDDGA
jgi:pyruvate dehydrogenase E2 component (dihydrolipoamide acetyltransferase)